ncbi:winged helix-turn-helix domain-containing protein [Streptomyces sp. NPDC005526]|uniref:ArsR/SmtB family transcription factor n=1 Tax=Streptomyces sp. NPDC005526 TaxID=3156885 RepID=UPI0033A09505
MLRLHLTPADMVRVRVVVLGPLAECQMSLGALQERGADAPLGGWRAASLRRLSPDARTLARGVATPRGHLDLYTLLGPVGDVAEGVDRLLTRGAGLREELSSHPPKFAKLFPAWVLEGFDGRRDASRRLADALTSAYESTVAPYWSRIQSLLTTEQSAAGQLLTRHGVHGLLESLRPWARWDPPFLEIAYTSWSGRDTYHLSGDGIVLAPSFFCRRPQVYQPAGGGEMLIVHPVVREPLAAAQVLRQAGEGPGRALAALLGRTRAAVLEIVQEGATTGEIAGRLGVAPATASEHTGALRAAGLLTSHREGQRVRHSLTPLGLGLLQGAG